MSVGVYLISSERGQYVGSSSNIKGRWSQHRYQLRNKTHANKKLQNAWNKYGEDNFKFEILSICSEALLLFHEQYYIDTLKPRYNLVLVAGRNTGMVHSPEAIAKMSKVGRGRKLSKAARKKISLANRKRVQSEETRAKISASNKGRRNSPEAIAKIAASKLGKPHTRKSRSNMRKAQLIRFADPSQKAAIIASNKNRGCSLETRAKMSAARSAYWKARR